jgi:hypothetical protein
MVIGRCLIMGVQISAREGEHTGRRVGGTEGASELSEEYLHKPEAHV